MQLFWLNVDRDKQQQMTDFLENNYICYGPSGIGDLERVSSVELQARLCLLDQQSIDREDFYNSMCSFMYEMQDGDYVIVSDGHVAHLGDLGDYYYVQQCDTAEENSGHRRGITWLSSILVEQLDMALKPLTGQPESIARFEREVTKTEIESWMSVRTADNSSDTSEHQTKPQVPIELISEAFRILHEAMCSDDPERRERAAIAVLGYARGNI